MFIVNCQKACKKCDVGRPCQRCIKYGLTDTCVNSVRKERKKGVKRGPYKKRNKSGGDSGTSSGASTPNMASPMASINYGQSTATRQSSQPATATAMPIHYAPFQDQGHYNPYAYANSTQMMPQAYMVPAAMQQMYPSNPPILSYMNMVSPQQQQQQVNGGYMQQQPAPAPTATAAAAASNSNTSTPTNTTTTSTTNNADAKPATADDDDDEGSKLTILSQLCSAVLDRNDTPKDEQVAKIEENTTTHQNTPPPSRPHSRETSHQQQQENANEGQQHNFGNYHDCLAGHHY